MDRLTISIDEALAREFDALIARRGYDNRSEALRDLIRREVEAARGESDGRGYCVASLSYVYEHDRRDLAERLAALQHAHHDLVIVTSHVHLDHDHCLENVFLKGRLAEVRAFADRLGAERGVEHAKLNLITVHASDVHPRGRAYHHHRGHLHLIPHG